MVLYNSRGDYLIPPELGLSTRKRNQVPNEQRLPRVRASMEAACNYVLQSYPNARVRSLSSVYNCMGMVFASRRTWVSPEHLDMILTDDEYKPIDDIGDLQRGDVVVYRDNQGEATHVGIVANVHPTLDNGQPQVTVLSQWGADGEYLHPLNDINPRLGNPSDYWTDRT